MGRLLPRDKAANQYNNTLLIAELGKHYKIAKVQIRLMVLEMQNQSLNDSYGMDRQQQEKLFVEIAKRCLNVPERAIVELLDK